MPLAPSFDTFGWFARDMETYRKVAGVLLAASPLRGGWPIAKGDWSGRAPSTTPAHRKVGALPQVPHPAGPSTSSGPDTLPSRGRDRSAPALNPRPRRAGPPHRCGRIRQHPQPRRRVTGATRGRPLSTPRHRRPLLVLPQAAVLRGLAVTRGVAGGKGPQARHRRQGERFDFARSVTARTAKSETLHRNDFRYELADLLGDDGVIDPADRARPARRLPTNRMKSLQAYREQALRLLCWSGLSGFPQLTLPLGMVDGAPFGISLLGPCGSDLALLDVWRADILSAVEGTLEPWTR